MSEGLLEVKIAGQNISATADTTIPWRSALTGVARAAPGGDLDIRQVQTCFDKDSGLVLRDAAAAYNSKMPPDELQFTLRPLRLDTVALKFTIIKEPRSENITDGPYRFRVGLPFSFPWECNPSRSDLYIQRQVLLNEVKEQMADVFAHDPPQGIVLLRGGTCTGKSTLLTQLARELEHDPKLVVMLSNINADYQHVEGISLPDTGGYPKIRAQRQYG